MGGVLFLISGFNGLTVLQAQLGEKLSVTDGCSTLQTDGTTKFGDHLQPMILGFLIKPPIVLGLDMSSLDQLKPL